jgi:hypothetical protein
LPTVGFQPAATMSIPVAREPVGLCQTHVETVLADARA